jgi:hypothetical protein
MDIVWQPEDSLREKKVESDLKDLLKTLVAFANSVAPGDTAQIFIGEKDDGTAQGVTNTENIQKKVRSECDKVYPEIYYKTEVYERDGKRCVRVDIKHNAFGTTLLWTRLGAAWRRECQGYCGHVPADDRVEIFERAGISLLAREDRNSLVERRRNRKLGQSSL